MDLAKEHRKIIGERIKHLRSQKGLYQSELSEKVGTTRTAVATYESGASAPQPYLLVKFAETLGTTVDYLVGATDNPAPRELTTTINNKIELSTNSDFILTLDGKELTSDEIKMLSAFIRTTRS